MPAVIPIAAIGVGATVIAGLMVESYLSSYSREKGKQQARK